MKLNSTQLLLCCRQSSRKSLLREVSEAADLTCSAAFWNRTFACGFAQSFNCIEISFFSFSSIFALNCIESISQTGASDALDVLIASLASDCLSCALGSGLC